MQVAVYVPAVVQVAAEVAVAANVVLQMDQDRFISSRRFRQAKSSGLLYVINLTDRPTPGNSNTGIDDFAFSTFLAYSQPVREITPNRGLVYERQPNVDTEMAACCTDW